MPALLGLHHVTAFAREPRENIAYYTGTLGLRLVKRTVNFDDPGMYHLYYGDETGSPGTLLTHFPHPQAATRRPGVPDIDEAIVGIPTGSVEAWAAHLTAAGGAVERIKDRGRAALRTTDPHGMGLRLCEDPAVTASDARPVRVEGVAITVADPVPAASLLRELPGFEAEDTDTGSWRIGAGTTPGRLEIRAAAGGAPPRPGAGTIHHVAWRIADEAALEAMAAHLASLSVPVSPVRDRQYFRSIYFRIPGGVIFEVATDGPGFEIDESRADLGTHLRLPPQFESRRSDLEATLPGLD